MKCFYCKEKIDDSQPHEITPPDGDCFHTKCYEKHKKEREHFFNNVIYDDKKFADWLGIDKNLLS